MATCLEFRPVLFRSNRVKIAIYTVAGFFFGLAGVTQMSRLRQGDPTVAVGVELDVIAAVVIGGGSLRSEERRVGEAGRELSRACSDKRYLKYDAVI